ncbi:MAG TPA: GspMb/PilO family protein [Acidobacteriaceae bacterium]
MKLTRSGTFNLLNAHIAAVAVLAIVNLVLLVQLGMAWHTLRTDRPEQLQLKQVELRTAQLQARPLRNLPQRIADSTSGADHFYAARVPGADSAILAELGSLEQKANVHLSRVQTAFAPALRDVTEVRMDASVSGDYASVMRFINSVERDKMFFVINGLTLTGQQGGLVNLRLRVTTYLRGSDVEHLQPISSGDEGTAGTDQDGGR